MDYSLLAMFTSSSWRIAAQTPQAPVSSGLVGRIAGAIKAPVPRFGSHEGLFGLDHLQVKPGADGRSVIERPPGLRKAGHLRALLPIVGGAPRDDDLRQIANLRVGQLVYELMENADASS